MIYAHTDLAHEMSAVVKTIIIITIIIIMISYHLNRF